MSAANPAGAAQSLRPRARLLQTLGIDLISSENVALIELVKNSYDADATQVVVRFSGPLTAGSGRVDVLDDGHGMSEERLRSTWLEIATPFRKRQPLSESGRRRVLGEKGIGRFAAARLASFMHLTTCRQKQEVDLRLDWNKFENDDLYLDQVQVGWDKGPPVVFTPGGEADQIRDLVGAPPALPGHGTLIRLDRLRRDWTRQDIQDLRRSLARLVTPSVSTRVDFAIIIDLPEPLTDLSGAIGPPEELERPPHRLTGHVTADGIAKVHVIIANGKPESVTERIPLNDGRPAQCGPFDIDLRVWDRDQASIRAIAPGSRVTDFRKLLDASAGVSVYRDGFRILPYGERGDDWLQLDSARVNNPSMRVSNNQVIGQVDITADDNKLLRDQSNREGLIHGPAYEDFRTLVKGALAILEERRSRHRRKTDPAGARPEATGGVFDRFDLKPVRDAINRRHPNDRELVQVLDDRETDISAGVRYVQEELARYQRLVTLGGLVDNVVHDGRTSNARIKNIVRFARRDLTKTELSCDERVAGQEDYLSQVAEQADFISELFRRIEPFGGRKRGRPTPFAIEDAIRDAVRVLESQLSEVGVTVHLPVGKTMTRADPAEIQEIVINLVDNARYWLSTQPKGLAREIVIQVARDNDGAVGVTVSDSGPGVPEDAREMIFEPYYSRRPDGTGLGLAIVGSIVADFYNGELALLDQGPLPGATFRATLRRRV